MIFYQKINFFFSEILDNLLLIIFYNYMETVYFLIDLFLHLDKHLFELVENYGFITHFILFVVIFCETGLVVTPFLPGDSLLFAAGALAHEGSPLNVHFLFFLLAAAGILGDSVNYFIGSKLGDKAYNSKYIKKEYLDKTHEFYEKHGGKTIIIARFVPIVRTFAPFVAGIGKMSYKYFLTYNVVGAILWVAIFIYGGYFFGNLPFVKNNFSIVIITIIFISILPGVINFLKIKFAKN